MPYLRVAAIFARATNRPLVWGRSAQTDTASISYVRLACLLAGLVHQGLLSNRAIEDRARAAANDAEAWGVLSDLLPRCLGRTKRGCRRGHMRSPRCAPTVPRSHTSCRAGSLSGPVRCLDERLTGRLRQAPSGGGNAVLGVLLGIGDVLRVAKRRYPFDTMPLPI